MRRINQSNKTETLKIIAFENPISLSSCYYETAPGAKNNVDTVMQFKRAYFA